MSKRNAESIIIKDGVLICRKSETAEAVTIVVCSAPELASKGSTLKEAEALLLKKVWRQCDLDEPIAIRYEVGLPGEPTGVDALVRISVNGTVDLADPGRYFELGFCSVCQSGQGGRNRSSLKLVSIPKGTTSGLMVRFQPYLKCGLRVGMQLFQEGIVRKLKSSCDSSLEFRAIDSSCGRAKKFYELIPKSMIAFVVPASRKGRIGGECSKCLSRFVYEDVDKRFISKGDADAIRQCGAAAIESNGRTSLCVTDKVWRQLQNAKCSQGLLTSPVVELDEVEINRKPKLEKIVAFKL